MDRGTPAPARLARCPRDSLRGHDRVGRGVYVVTLLGVLVLAVSLVLVWVTRGQTVTHVTLTMPCSRIHAASVGHAAYGLDQVLTASCSPTATAHP